MSGSKCIVFAVDIKWLYKINVFSRKFSQNIAGKSAAQITFRNNHHIIGSGTRSETGA